MRSLVTSQQAALAAAPLLFFPEELDCEFIGPAQQQGCYTA
jgi:hypothetical protein